MCRNRNVPTFEKRLKAINRRHFLRGSVGAGVSLSTPLLQATPSRELQLFDVHVHLAQAWYGTDRGPLTVQDILKWMDRHRIAQAAILPLVSPEAFWYPITSEYVLAETKPYRDRLVPFCGIDPRTLDTHLTSDTQVTDMLRRYRDAGARGFGEHKAKLDIDHPLNMRLYAACQEVDLPVLFHLDNRANMDRPGLPGLENVLRQFPQLTMIGHGKGWWASISGGVSQADLHVGYPRGPVQDGGAIDRLMNKYQNLYGDLSSSGAHAILRDHAFGQAFLKRRCDRLLFGTDYYDLTQSQFPQFDLFESFELSPEARNAITTGNAERILLAQPQ
ncbi:MAG: amidohydrolase [Planctomycetaceae bacterium]|nr:amidohydrolase [Planctomycetaceae bacterium]